MPDVHERGVAEEAEVVPPPLHQHRLEVDPQVLPEERQVLVRELFLQADGVGGDDHLPLLLQGRVKQAPGVGLAVAQAAQQLEPHMLLAKLNTENEQSIAARYGIRSIPTIAIFKGGRVVAQQAGAMDSGSLINWAKSQLR